MIRPLVSILAKYRYGEVTKVCLPLVLGMSVTTVMEFTDRVFLSNYSLEAISAASPAGITAFLFVAFFGGISGYVGVFIAQYHGSGAHDRIGRVLWQGIYFSVFAGLICWVIARYATVPIFAFAGHEPEVRRLEETYFSILCQGAFFHIAMHALSAFFTGRGLTRPVLLITMTGVTLNIPLDYALIFGRWGLPELGMAGAAIATVIGWAINFLLLFLLIFTRKSHSRFGIFANRSFDRQVLFRLLRFGVPGSLQFTIDILAFTIFILMVGRLGTVALAATNIVFSINALAYMPAMGVSQGVAVLVGQALGRQRPDEARIAVWSSVHLLLLYILVVDLAFIFMPEIALRPFLHQGLDQAMTKEVASTAITLLRIVAIYLFMDALYMVFSGALKGAGDTRFLMYSVGLCSLLVFILPVYCGIRFLNMSLLAAWYCVLLFIMILFLLAAWRYRQGQWQKMLVIERDALADP